MSRSDKTGAKAARTRRHKASKSRSRSRSARHSSIATVKRLARVTRERDEALEQQVATGEILKVISQSAFALEAVLEALVTSAVRLCHADTGIIRLREGNIYPVAATVGFTEEERDHFAGYSVKADRGSVFGRAILERRSIHVPDLLADRDLNQDRLKDFAKAVKIRSGLGVPLLREGTTIGVFTLQRWKRRPFTRKQIELVETFANQAVIAIENTRLFDEVQARTRDLSEALTYQSGSANILSVIASSPTDVQPVLKAIVESACELCEAYDAVVILKDGEQLQAKAHHGPIPLTRQHWVNDRTSSSGRAIADRRPVHLHDVLSEEGEEFALARSMSRVDGCRTLLSAPLLREGEAIGAIALRRAEVHPFGDKQIALLQTFADQAVIALGNVRLFEQVQQRTRELSESLQQQTATSEVLQIISSSPGELDPVFDKMLENATRVCGAEFGSMVLVEGETFRNAAIYNAPQAFTQARVGRVMQIHPRSSMSAAIRSRQVVQVEDLRNTPSYLEGNPSSVQLAELGGARTIVVVPMLRDERVIGLITVYRQEVRPFGDKQVDLLRNFARQAVIAIENARLLRELRQRTDDLSEALVYQTGSSNILKVIASSPTDVGPALKAIVDSACEICSAYDAGVLLKDGEDLVVSAHHGPIPPGFTKNRISRKWVTGRAVVDKAPQHVHNLTGPEGDDFQEGRDLARQHSYHTVLAVPLLQEDEAIGAIVVRRMEVQPFNDKQVELLKSFADQAVIAISNVRLFEQVQQRTRELAKSLDDLRTAQGRLIQTEKLASLGQLTAGIAHEIKNPLNFVNNFSAVSSELTDELSDVLTHERLTDKGRKEVAELTGLLRNNLDKVVQHGKRADSIVKNMLLHSREGAGERRLVDVNALVEESLNLAYHGARAEKQGFTIALERSFDPGAGEVEAFPQEITRVLLNLISNGFYAATKRQARDGGNGFEPTITAATKSLGDRVEIRIRDNGIGIPPEVRQKMFNPFFTTKPAGEGTGLGLSISHDIIVKQHAGAIEVETEPGEFTELRIILPRIAT
jgi:two-component system NtrC family sensor kinase